MTYDRLNTDELRGSTQADYLVALDAHFRLVDGDLIIYDEPAFPVVELARSLSIWLDALERGDFEFDSMSYEQVGSVAVRQSDTGWTFESIFAANTSATAFDWTEVDRCCREFVTKVEADLAALGLDPAEVIRR